MPAGARTHCISSTTFIIGNACYTMAPHTATRRSSETIALILEMPGSAKDHLSGPMQDTPPPYPTMPFRDSIAEGVSHAFCLVFIGCRASIAEIPLCGRGGYCTSTSHALQGGNAQKRGGGIAPNLGDAREQFKSRYV